jgi:hypothetical protein
MLRHLIHPLLLVVGLLTLLVGSCSKQPPPPVSKFHPGQVWAFTTPKDQPNAKLTILRVEDGGKHGTIVHIAISGLSYGNGQDKIQHLPFSESAIERSVTKLENETGPVPDFSDGYQEWRQAFEAGKGGIFNVTVAEVLEPILGKVSELK